MNGAEGPNKMPRFTKERRKRWHHKRMRKECDIGDKMLMNSSSKESFKTGRKDHHSRLSLSHGVITL